MAAIWRDLADAKLGAPAFEWPKLRRQYDRLRERPAVQAMLAIHGLS